MKKTLYRHTKRTDRKNKNLNNEKVQSESEKRIQKLREKNINERKPLDKLKKKLMVSKKLLTINLGGGQCVSERTFCKKQLFKYYHNKDASYIVGWLRLIAIVNYVCNSHDSARRSNWTRDLVNVAHALF